jgi:pimeloyl-ACP methyl ester carboxylesterase
VWLDRFVDNGGVRLSVRDYGGAGPAVVLVHGGPGQNLATWDDFAPLLTPRCHVAALDMRGNGLSGNAPDYSYPALVSDIHAVVEHLGLLRPVIVGHSWGGQLAVYYASRFSTCRGVVGIDGWITDVRLELGDDVWNWMEESYAVEPLMAFSGTVEELELLIGIVARELGPSAASVTRRQFVPAGDGNYRWARSVSELVHIQRTIDREGLGLSTEVYGDIECPVLLIGGEHSPGERDARLLPWGFSRTATDPIVERFPHVNSVWWPCGHDIPHEKPDMLAQTLVEFVSALP